MARLQIFHLPVVDGAPDARPQTPFAVVLDDVTEEQAAGLGPIDPTSLGAMAVLVFRFPVEVL